MALPKIRVITPKPEDIVLGCIHAGSPDVTDKSLRKYVGVPVISVPTLYKLEKGDMIQTANFHADLDKRRKEFAGMAQKIFGNCDFVIIHNEMTPGMRIELEALFPPSPFNRFFKTE